MMVQHAPTTLFFLIVLSLGLVLALIPPSRQPYQFSSDEIALMQTIQTVHVVYMTHLDCGFTAYTQQVFQQYIDEWFPKAFQTAEELRTRGGPERFIWTTHPYLLHEYLRNGTAEQVKNLTSAILKGDITWHAGPFNLEAELMTPDLFMYGIELGSQLDEMFEPQPPKTALSQKDVPGTTKAVIPLLNKMGVKFVHIGVNDFSTPPAAPVTKFGPICNTFVWQDDDSGMDMMTAICNGYSREPWGVTPELMVVVPGLADALVYLMMVDNTGPQDANQTITGWANIRQLFPNATIIASSLGTFADRLETVKDQLPVFNQEIGDTWIYGVQSDPGKVRKFRELMRLRTSALQNGLVNVSDPGWQEFSRLMVKVAEHTWGIHNLVEGIEQYDNAFFESQRNQSGYLGNEYSWNEQRWFLYRALDALGNLSIANEFRQALDDINPTQPDLTGFKQVPPQSLETPQTCGNITLSFDATVGSISSLIVDGRQWVSNNQSFALFLYQSLSEQNFTNFQAAYNVPPYSPAIDFGKPGLANSGAENVNFLPSVVSTFVSLNGSCSTFLFNLTVPETAYTQYGAPRVVYVQYTVANNEIDIKVQWFNKTTTRMAESIWMSFAPKIIDPLGWRFNKMNMASVEPTQVAINGSRYMHAVMDGGVTYWEDDKLMFQIETLDAACVTPGTPFFLRFDAVPLQTMQGVHFNLFNNAWNTNYIMWYEDNELFRFKITFY